MRRKRKEPAAMPKHAEPESQPLATTARLDPRLAAAIARGKLVVKKLAAAEGGAISCEETARLLGIPEAAVKRRWRDFRLVGWRELNVLHIPVWQFSGKKLLPGIEDVLKIFRSHDQWRVMLYFLGPRLSLNRLRPLDMLRCGEAAEVIKHATAYDQDDAW
jgi:hypothetical protein